jgi:hypothetical protein
MIGARRYDRTMPELPGNRAGNACVAKGSGVPAQRTKGQIRAWLTVRAPGRRGKRLSIAAQNVPTAHPRAVRGHSMPIARTAGGAV